MQIRGDYYHPENVALTLWPSVDGVTVELTDQGDDSIIAAAEGATLPEALRNLATKLEA